MNRYFALVRALLAPFVVFAGLIAGTAVLAVSYDRADARNEPWNLTWQGVAIAVLSALVIWAFVFAYRRLKDQNPDNDKHARMVMGAGIAGLVIGIVLTALVSAGVIDVDITGSLLTIGLIAGGLLVFLLFVASVARIYKPTNPTPSQP